MKPRVEERAFLEKLRHRFGKSQGQVRLSLGDDAAIFSPARGFESLLTCDLLVEKVHFDLKTISPWELGAKSLAASLSDLAAMGGIPRGFLISLSIPKRAGLGAAFFDSFYSGLQAWAGAFGCQLMGGDTTKSPGPLVIDIMALGEVERGRALLRSTLRPGDLVCVTGTLGDSAAGLMTLQRRAKGLSKGAKILLQKRHKTPLPKVLVGRYLLRHRLASACIDVSDGLASEAGHLARESGVRVEIEGEAVPLSASARLAAKVFGKSPLQWALHGGEDYELLFGLPLKRLKQMEKFADQTGSSFHVIGRARRGKGAWIRQAGRLRPLKGGYEHRIF